MRTFPSTSAIGVGSIRTFCFSVTRLFFLRLPPRSYFAGLIFVFFDGVLKRLFALVHFGTGQVGASPHLRRCGRAFLQRIWLVASRLGTSLANGSKDVRSLVDADTWCKAIASLMWFLSEH